jgi:hypothetical protein
MKWPWPPLGRKDTLGIAFVFAVLVLSIFLMVRYPDVMHQSRNAGFDAGWDCTRTGSGEQVCVKKVGTGK